LTIHGKTWTSGDRPQAVKLIRIGRGYVSKELNTTLDELEAAQADLRESIEKVMKIAQRSDRLMRRHRAQLRERE